MFVKLLAKLLFTASTACKSKATRTLPVPRCNIQAMGALSLGTNEKYC